MALLDFLGNIGNAMAGQQPGPMPGLIGGFAGGTFDLDGKQVTPVDPYASVDVPMNGIPGIRGVFGGEQVPEPPAPAPEHHSGLRSFLGNLGDALLVGSGHEPIYGPRQQRKQIGEKLASYLGVNDPNLVEIMRRDPETGFKLWKASQPSQGEAFTLHAGDVRYGPDGKIVAQADASPGNDPSFIREIQALGIDPHSREALELYSGRNSPAGYLLKPPGEGQADNLPTVADAAGYAAIPPGGHYRDPQGNIRTKGGGGGNVTSGFPGR